MNTASQPSNIFVRMPCSSNVQDAFRGSFAAAQEDTLLRVSCLQGKCLQGEKDVQGLNAEC